MQTLIRLLDDIGDQLLGPKWTTVAPMVAAWLQANPEKAAALHARILAYAKEVDA